MDRRTDLNVFRNDEFLKLIEGNVQGPVWRVFTRFIIRNVATDSIENIAVPPEELSAANRTSDVNDAQTLDNQESTADAEINACSENETIHTEPLNNKSEVYYKEEITEIDKYKNSSGPDTFKIDYSNIFFIEYDNLYDEIIENDCCQNTVGTVKCDFKTNKNYNTYTNSSYNDKKEIEDSIIHENDAEKIAPLSAILPSTCDDKQIDENKKKEMLYKADDIDVHEYESEADRKLLKILKTIELDDIDINENIMLLKNYNANYSRKAHSKPFVRIQQKKEPNMNINNKYINNINIKQTDMAKNVEKIDPEELQTYNYNAKDNSLGINNYEKTHENALKNTGRIGKNTNNEDLIKTKNLTNTKGGDIAQINVIQNYEAGNDHAIDVGCLCGIFNVFGWFV